VALLLGEPGTDGWTSRILRGGFSILESFPPLNEAKRLSTQRSSGRSLRRLAVRAAHLSKTSKTEMECRDRVSLNNILI
jgi:hypothetical protein